MQLVVDTNILFSFFRENPVRFMIINSKLLSLKLSSPAYVLDEIKDNIPDIIKYSKSKLDQIESMIGKLKESIDIVQSNKNSEFEEKGKEVSPDPKDSPFFALALKLKADIWSNEPRLKQQSLVKVWSTGDLRKELGL